MAAGRQARVVLVDAEDVHRYAAARTLRRAGYAVTETADSTETLEQVEKGGVVLVLTAVRTAAVDGLELLRQLKERSPAVSVILMDDGGSLERAVAGLRLGASDYLVKPCSAQDIRSSAERGVEQTRRLLHRRRLLESMQRDLLKLMRDGAGWADDDDEPERPHRPVRPPVIGSALRIGALMVRPGHYQVEAGEETIILTPTEFDLLLYLAANQGRVVSCHELVREVRGYATSEPVARDVIRPHISNLRRKLRGLDKGAGLIINVRGIGYRLSAMAEKP